MLRDIILFTLLPYKAHSTFELITLELILSRSPSHHQGLEEEKMLTLPGLVGLMFLPRRPLEQEVFMQGAQKTLGVLRKLRLSA